MPCLVSADTAAFRCTNAPVWPRCGKAPGKRLAGATLGSRKTALQSIRKALPRELEINEPFRIIKCFSALVKPLSPKV